tara:strand:+ start:614 stop:793 length:180 start_codon:yes stop_codon:yes gene_type:complete
MKDRSYLNTKKRGTEKNIKKRETLKRKRLPSKAKVQQSEDTAKQKKERNRQKTGIVKKK